MIFEVDGEFYAYRGQTLIGVYSLRSRAAEALQRFE